MGKAPVYVRSFENGFARTVQVRFGDCDPAGIVFYPRYFEMFNNLVEDWCAQGLGLSFHELIQVRGLGLPTVSLTTDFIAPSRLGEELRAELSVRDVGGAKIMLAIRLSGPDGSERVGAILVLVLTDLQAGRAKRIPDAMRVSIERFRPPRQP
ncbi:acyl-CoA thioesterase [Massilia sp. CFBP 13647]|uniref:acyl-CoA thioesterase n=1 Tax=unclassified Massilia TaxID=2609279 RepID=UPI0035A6603E